MLKQLKQLNPVYVALAFSTFFGAALLLGRYCFSGEMKFFFLVWNLFLAYIPLGLAWLIQYEESKNKNRFLVLMPLALMWLLFLPNAPYILTDLFHLKQREVPLWYDLVVLLTFAWNGLYAGLISVNVLHDIVRNRTSELMGWLFVATTLTASAFGIFLGRYLRWNSWDVISRPGHILHDIAEQVLHPFQNLSTVGMTVTFSFLLFFMYSMLRRKENQIFLSKRVS